MSIKKNFLINIFIIVLVFYVVFLLTGSENVTADNILKYEDTGSEVRSLQKKLHELDFYEGSIDGVFGVMTETAVRNFQEASDLRVDGLVGPSTRNQIESTLEDSDISIKKDQFLRRGDYGQRVSELKKMLREKGFLAREGNSEFCFQTARAVELLQEHYGLQVDGVVGPRTWNVLEREENYLRSYTLDPGDTLWDLSAKWNVSVDELKDLNNIDQPNRLRAGDNINIPGDIKTEDIEIRYWNQVDNIINDEDIYTVTDIETGLHFRLRRFGGTYHADSEPLTAEDTSVLREIYGGDFSWERRAVVVHLNGNQVAASINGMPHGGESIYNNNFPGHICVHFRGSKTHANEVQDNDHQNMIDKADKQSWPLGVY